MGTDGVGYNLYGSRAGYTQQQWNALSQAQRDYVKMQYPNAAHDYNVAHNDGQSVLYRWPPVPGHPQGPITITEALISGFLPGYDSHGAVRTAKYRNPDAFPPVLGARGPVHLYEAAALRKWALATQGRSKPKRRKRVSRS